MRYRGDNVLGVRGFWGFVWAPTKKGRIGRGWSYNRDPVCLTIRGLIEEYTNIRARSNNGTGKITLRRRSSWYARRLRRGCGHDLARRINYLCRCNAVHVAQ